MSITPRNIYDRAKIVDEDFVEFLRSYREPPRHAIRPSDVVPGSEGVGEPLTGADLLELLECQLLARQLDLGARVLRARDQAYYTIGSAGHEGNAVLGRLTRSTDPAFLHYRSAGFMVARSRSVEGVDPIRDTVLSQVAASEDPIAGGRHKVWGNARLWVLPQTSTIASHLPKAVGCAIGIRRARKLGIDPPVPDDSIVVCSFGDASLNHSTALGAINAASRAAYQQVACPILFVCEDNGLGISVRTPTGWVADHFGRRPGFEYYRADGLDVVEAHRVAARAIATCRERRRPVFLHLEVVRMLGHAGTDVELEYRTLEEVEATERRDPLRRTAARAIEAGLCTPQEILASYEDARRRVADASASAVERPKLRTAEEILKPLAPYSPRAVRDEASRVAPHDRRVAVFGSEDKLPERARPRHLAALINAALHDLMALYPEAILFGEDVAQKGGVYHVTANLAKRFPHARVFNTILDETNILGLAQGFGYMGLLPLPEIQYLAYFHNACDQIRGEACSTQFFSNDQFRNPMVLRIASLAYQKGFGGHFHNDNSIAALRDIPGLVVACPSRGDDAVGMLRTCTALAKVDGRVVAYLEPIALYMTKDLFEPRDGQWSFAYPEPGFSIPVGEGRVYHEDADDVAIVTYGNGVPMSLRVAASLRATGGPRCRVLDLRWLAPFDAAWIAGHVAACGRAVVVDEGRRSGGIGEALVAEIAERVGGVPTRRVAGRDTYIPLGPAAHQVLPSEAEIRDAVLDLAPGR